MKIVSFVIKALIIIAIIFFVSMIIFYIYPGLNKLCNICISNTIQDEKDIFDLLLSNANWTLLYVTVLFTIAGIGLGIAGIFWIPKMQKIKDTLQSSIEDYKNLKKDYEELKRDYEKVRKNSDLEANLIISKIYYYQQQYDNAYEFIKKIKENYSYEVPLFKAKIIMDRKFKHKKYYTDSIFNVVDELLQNAKEFEYQLQNEDKAKIFSAYSTLYLRETSNYQKALDYANIAIENDNSHWAAYIIKGMALKRLNRIDEAIICLKEILDMEKTYDIAYYNLACYYSLKIKSESAEKKKEYKDAAIENYLRAIEINPKIMSISINDPDLESISADIKRIRDEK